MTGTLRVTAAAVLATAVVAGLSACTDDPKPKTLPSLTPSASSPSPSTTSTKGMTDKEQIKATYTEYRANWTKAQDLPRDERKDYLKQWFVEPQLSASLDVLRDLEKDSLRFEGHPEPHIMRLDVRNEAATVHDCSDDRHGLLRNTRTGKIEERFGHNWYIAEFEKTDRGWRVRANQLRKKSCVAQKS